ncbi:rhombosortase [Sinimarinibacterium sp. CAU 1509]|uniref:rhombosortase n=1 Tax=Sinimarinibacterium sp. CAU 1509 TaxID=2562283 RepID=UPI002009F046|nr:rhombosortase [Sinimarinibacterium sp. CAU 1509]
MISNSPYRSAGIWFAPLVLMALMLIAECLGDWGRAAFAYDRGLILEGQWWRLLTGNFVHLGWYHLFLNQMGVLVLVLLCPENLSGWAWLRRVVWLSVFMTLCLLAFVPQMHRYVGMSGVIHGLFVLGLLPQVMRRDLIASGCLAYLTAKIAWEFFAGAPVSDEAAIGGHVATESHLYGVVGALAYTAVFRTLRGEEAFKASPAQDNIKE